MPSTMPLTMPSVMPSTSSPTSSSSTHTTSILPTFALITTSPAHTIRLTTARPTEEETTMKSAGPTPSGGATEEPTGCEGGGRTSQQGASRPHQLVQWRPGNRPGRTRLWSHTSRWRRIPSRSRRCGQRRGRCKSQQSTTSARERILPQLCLSARLFVCLFD